MGRRRGKRQVRRGDPELPHPKCIYCNLRDGVQREHVIARAFLKPPFSNMPMVPACEECNSLKGDGGQRNMSDDEAYVRDRICMHDNAEAHPVANELLHQAVSRSLNRPEGWREKDALVASMRPAGTVWVRMGGILYPVNRTSFHIDLSRFERVMRKIVKGLYYWHMGHRLPEDYGIVVLPRMDQEMYDHARRWIDAHDPSPTYTVGIEETVKYQFASRQPHPLGHNWLVMFYKSFAFYAHTGPRRDFDEANLAADAAWRPSFS